jgi:hypothetical protein
MDPTAKIAFFDNESKHITSVSSSFPSNIITCVHVDSTQKNPLLDGVQSYTGKSYPSLPIFAGNTYAMAANAGSGEPHVPSRGITMDNILEIAEWLGDAPHDKSDHQLIFDWDQTLSVIEGALFAHCTYPTYDSVGIKVEDAIVYLMGGPERLVMIKQFFQYLKIRNVRVTILTNSPGALPDGQKGGNRSQFLQLLRGIIDPAFPDHELVSSVIAPFGGVKGPTLEAYFLKYPPSRGPPPSEGDPPSGGRKRRCKKSRKMYKKQRKQTRKKRVTKK